MGSDPVLTDDDVAMANLQRGPASDGCDRRCASCDRKVRKGSPLFWQHASYEYPDEGRDAYCGACTMDSAETNRLMCAAIDAEMAA